MAVPVAVHTASVTIGSPQVLFPSGNGVAGDLRADHSGGIVALRVGASQIESINVMTNWTAVLRAPAND